MEASRARVRRSRAKDASERKRSIYIPLACQMCKRRKVRCDGCSPCAACQRHSTECVYEAAVENCRKHAFSRAAKSDTAQERSNEVPASELRYNRLEKTTSSSPLLYNHALEVLGHTLASFHGRITALERLQQPDLQPERYGIPQKRPTSGEDGHKSEQDFTTVTDERAASVFAGPTSANFSFQVADRMLRRRSDHLNSSNMTGEDEIEVCVSPEDDASRENISPESDITLAEAIRLIHIYSDVMNSLHPILNMTTLIEQAKAFYIQGRSISQPVTAETCHLMMVIAIALLAEKGGRCSTALAIYQRTKPLVADVSLVQSFTLRGQTLLILTVRPWSTGAERSGTSLIYC